LEFVEPARSRFRRQPAHDQAELVRIAAQIEASPYVDGVQKFLTSDGQPYYKDGHYWLAYEHDPSHGWRVLDFGYPGYVR
jgi:hypothetical protein